MGVRKMNQHITARFDSGDQINTALWNLRRAGAVCHTGTLPYAPSASSATLHLMVRGTDASLARTIIRQSGGRVQGA